MRHPGSPPSPSAVAGGASRSFIAGLGVAQICSWGSLYYSFPLIAEAMEADLGWSKPELFGAATIGLLLQGLASYPVGAAIDRGHGRAVMAGGSVMAGLLLLLWSQVEALWTFYLAVAGIGCLQAALLYEPAFAVVARRVGPAHARAPITALTLWGGFASTVFVPLVQLLLDTVGWRQALVALGVTNLVLCAAIYYSVIDPAREIETPVTAASEAGGRGSGAVAQAARMPVFWALALAFVAYAACLSAFTFHLYPMLVERGLTAAEIVGAMMLIGPAQVAARVVLWSVAKRSPVRVFGSVTVVAFAASMLIVYVAPASMAIVAGAILLYGAANGVMTIVRGIAVPEMVTHHAYGAVNGALAAPSTVARALAPLGAASLWSLTGSYDAVLLAILLATLVLCGSFWTAAALARPSATPSRVAPPS